MTIAEQTRPLRAALGRSDRYTDLRGELGEQLLLAAGPAGHERDAAIEKHRRIASTSAAEWLRTTPLHRALIARASQ